MIKYILIYYPEEIMNTDFEKFIVLINDLSKTSKFPDASDIITREIEKSVFIISSG